MGAVLLIVPAIASAQSSNYPSLLISIQTANGSAISPSQGTVTVNGPGASLSGTPSGSNTLTYATGFNNDVRTATFLPGSYNVSISSVPNYSYTYSSGCNGSLGYGTSANCSIVAYYNGNGSGGGNGTLTVYVQVNNGSNGLCSNGTYNCYNSYTNCYGNYNYSDYNTYNNCGNYNYSPSSFTISVSGNGASPASFQGSSSGTAVALQSGYYSINPNYQSGWTYTTSGNCSGTMNGGQSYSCTVIYNPTGTYLSAGGQLACSPAYQTVALGSAVTFTASGGNGIYAWTGNNQNYTNTGATFILQAAAPGPQTVEVSSNGQSAACTANVLGSGLVSSSGNGQPPGSYYIGPQLPNTGYEPHTPLQFALAALILLGAAIISYPYVRNALAHIWQ